MSKESSVAPKERVNIVYKPATGNAQEEVELPLKILMMGDYTGRPDDRPLEERTPINVDKDNFNEVMAQQNLDVDRRRRRQALRRGGRRRWPWSCKFKNLTDFEPEGVVNQVPELKKLLELRAALTALKGPLGNVPAFRKKIQALLGDDEGRKRLIDELGLKDDGRSQTK